MASACCAAVAAQVVGVRGAVGDEPPDRSGMVEKTGRDGDVVDVAGGQDQDTRPAFGVGERVELARAATLGLAERLLEPPLPAGRRAVRLDVRAVDRRQAVNAAVTGQRLEDVEPQPLPAPAIEPVVDRRVGPVGRRAVTSPRAGAQHVHDAADHPPVIDPPRPTPAARQQRLDPRPFRIAQPRDSLHRKPPAVWMLGSNPTGQGNP